jgi:hypothetical protein
MNKKLFIVKGTTVFVAMTLLGTTMMAVMNLEEAFAPTSFRAPTRYHRRQHLRSMVD